MKKLAIISLLCFSLRAEIFQSESLVIIEHQMGAYFSHPVIREAAKNSTTGIITVYVDPARSNTRTERSRTLNFIREKIVQYSPKTLYLDTTFLDVVDSIKYSGKIVEVTQSQAPERNSEKLIKFVEASGLPKNFYILHDKTSSSKIAAYEYKTRLVNKYDSKNVKMVKIQSFQDIRNWLNLEKDNGVILNCMTLLLDREVSKYKFSVDIKKELTQNNTKFFDIGFTDSEYNESLILVPNYSALHQKTFKQEQIEVKSLLLVNQDRLKSLGKFQYLAEAFKQIDGLTK